jgi:hypothetical protein
LQNPAFLIFALKCRNFVKQVRSAALL